MSTACRGSSIVDACCFATTVAAAALLLQFCYASAVCKCCAVTTKRKAIVAYICSYRRTAGVPQYDGGVVFAIESNMSALLEEAALIVPRYEYFSAIPQSRQDFDRLMKGYRLTQNASFGGALLL